MKIGKNDREMLATSTLAYDEYAMNKLNVFDISDSRKGEEMWLQFKTMHVSRLQEASQNECISQGQTVNQHCYLEVQKTLWESFQRKRPKFLPNKWILHHAKSSAYDVLRFRKFLVRNPLQKWNLKLIRLT